MLFVEFRFLIFFAIVFSVHWTLRGNRGRKVWLLACSHFFYACFFVGNPVSFIGKVLSREALPEGWWFPLVLIGSTVMDYVVGLGIAGAETERRRKGWLMLSLAANLGVLALFKYFNFFTGSASEFLQWFGLPTSDWTLKIILPYGVSFYTFQSMSYSIDVYRRRLEPVRSFLDLAFFISFFPQLVAGPIVRAMTFLPQVFVRREWKDVDVRHCLVLFFIGFVKKACISENVAPIADAVFAAPGSYDVFGTYLGVLFYAVQIYCDFSGYTDMALGTAGLLGYGLTVNFNFPYFARDISDFWRRWHISLSTWLRDYLYISLGGNRGSKLFTCRNLMLTMLLGGLWHGASWNFVIWGALHGVALIVHREWQQLTQNAAAGFKRAMLWIGPLLCFYWICITWIFFRAQPILNKTTHEVKASGLEVAQTVLESFVLFKNHGDRTFPLYGLWFFLGLVLIHWMAARGLFATWWRRVPSWAFAAMLGAGWGVALLFVPLKYKAFIYFQF